MSAETEISRIADAIAKAGERPTVREVASRMTRPAGHATVAAGLRRWVRLTLATLSGYAIPEPVEETTQRRLAVSRLDDTVFLFVGDVMIVVDVCEMHAAMAPEVAKVNGGPGGYRLSLASGVATRLDASEYAFLAGQTVEFRASKGGKR